MMEEGLRNMVSSSPKAYPTASLQKFNDFKVYVCECTHTVYVNIADMQRLTPHNHSQLLPGGHIFNQVLLSINII